jgi:hypothetical protein
LFHCMVRSHGWNPMHTGSCIIRSLWHSLMVCFLHPFRVCFGFNVTASCFVFLIPCLGARHGVSFPSP